MTLKELQKRSYVPYSGKPSVSVVRSVEGNLFPGVRIENTAFPLTINAAQNAIFSCLSEGERPKALYVEDTGANDITYWKQEYNVWTYELEELENLEFKSILLPENETEVKATLQGLFQKAVVANSDFPVSALLLTGQGYVSGVNVECSEWNLGLCAERVAIAKALSYGYTDFKTLHVHTRDGEFSSPCGSCRQVIIEHLPRNPVHLYHADGTHSKHYSMDLLPHSFLSSSLKRSLKKTD